ncbi:NHL domain-containing protein [Conexibacter woesei]|uniref:NHL repeat containing protein n=1 Tax=Conexibacter woesei (strain DSM 14684 / CCUG 47730 / CIP 108061 / JCM 11494 / NBRC 100937 / ID131577) TaxID=469383 RepID=D3FBS1_CONWI|nr:NHL repeat containing protein [Conexibacter woesei]ADB51336.1 NHL repeat containing protein [Conexibacter woesei DSM 14684]
MTRFRRAFAPFLAAAVATATVVAGTMAPAGSGLGTAAAMAADRVDTLAGSGTGGFGGDGAPATSALLTSPSDIGLLSDGTAYLIADTSNHRIRRVDAAGLITTVAGAGPANGATGTFAGEGVPATDATVRLNQPRGVSPTGDGGFLIADTLNNRIRRVDAAGLITTVAGTGAAAFTGDGGPATAAALNAPQGVAALPDGSFLIADTGNHRIRRVDAASGRIERVVGNLTMPNGGYAGDNDQAINAAVLVPARVAPLAGGGFLIADTGNNRIRRVDTRGVITTVAGSAAPAGFGGDGGPATAAALNQPEGVAAGGDGSILIADSTNERIRQVGADGVIRTLAGTGTLGLSGDGGLPTAAQLSHPRAVAASGPRMWIADSFNHRVRGIAPEPVRQGQDPPAQADPAPPRQVPPGVSPPVLGRSTVVAPVSGRVLIRLPGTRRFVLLRAIANIPLGAELDTRRGRASLLFTTTPDGRRASAIVSEGRFIVRQGSRLDLGQRPGQIVLSGPLAGCRALTRRGAARRGSARPRAQLRPRAAASARRKGKRGRRARVHADGRIEVRGRYGAAIVRGTRWTTVDRCPADPHPGTLFAVSEGRVRVTSFLLRRSRLVRAGQRYLAPARRVR